MGFHHSPSQYCILFLFQCPSLNASGHPSGGSFYFGNFQEKMAVRINSGYISEFKLSERSGTLMHEANKKNHSEKKTSHQFKGLSSDGIFDGLIRY